MTNEADEFLAHHGVMGMHWGSRKGGGSSKPSGGGSGKPAGPSARAVKSQARAQNHLAKVQTKQNNIAERDKAILKARANVEKTGARLKVAKAEYRVNKHTMDKTSAKAELGKHKAAHAINVHDANLQTHAEQVQARNEAIAGAAARYLG